MATDTGEMSCETKTWVAAAAAGLVVFLVSIWLFGWGFFVSLVLGVAVLVGLGVFVTRNYCGADATGRTAPAATAQPPAGGGASDTKPAASTQPQPTGVVPPAADPETERERDRSPEVPLSATPEADKAAAGPGKGARSDASQDPATGRPDLLDAPRGEPDDLKRIKGVGPKLEEKLHGMGIYHYSQIAAWSEAEIAWVDDQLNFRGRIERDGWIEQAKTLAAGGETEFSRRSGGGKEG